MAIQPTETIFSFLVRWNKLLGLPADSDMCQSVFGKSKVRIHPYLPSQLAMIEQSVSVPSKDLLFHHTLFPLFAFFNLEGATKLKRAMLHSKQTVTSYAGIPHAKIPLTFAHKWCPICLEESIGSKGFPILNIEHQIPGVISCARHKCYLHMALAGDNELDRHFKIAYPHATLQFTTDIAHKFAQYAHAVLGICKSHSVADLLDIYRAHLRLKGYITKFGYLRISKLKEDFSTIFQCEQFITESPVEDSLKNANFLGPLLRNKTSFPAHPLKHLLFTFWLFDADAQQFTQKVSPLVSPHRVVEAKESNEDKVLILLQQGISMNEIEAQTGKSRCFIRRISELNNIPHFTNSMVYSSETKRAVQMKALIGKHRNDIAKELSVGIGYVEQIISNTPFLSESRKYLRHQMKIKILFK